MQTELENKLYEDFPEMFAQRQGNSRLVYGLEIGDGWEPIIRKICEILSSREFIYLKHKERFPKELIVKRVAHNLCRKIERLFGLEAHSLYNMRYPSYEKFQGYTVEFSQIKEKFGTLRVYYDICPRFTEKEIEKFDKKILAREKERFEGFVHGVVSYAEFESAHVCEHDGAVGKLYTDGWWRTLCVGCEEKRKLKI